MPNWSEIEVEKHNVLEIDALTLENMVVAHIEQSLPMCNIKLG